MLAAFALIAALVLFSYLIAAGWRTELPSEAVRLFRLGRVGDVTAIFGSLGTLVLGIAIAIEREAYTPWDGWIVAAIALWLISGKAGRRTGVVYNAARDRAKTLVSEAKDGPSPELGAMLRSRKGLWLHTATTVLILLLLIDMIWKPGASA